MLEEDTYIQQCLTKERAAEVQQKHLVDSLSSSSRFDGRLWRLLSSSSSAQVPEG